MVISVTIPTFKFWLFAAVTLLMLGAARAWADQIQEA